MCTCVRLVVPFIPIKYGNYSSFLRYIQSKEPNDPFSENEPPSVSIGRTASYVVEYELRHWRCLCCKLFIIAAHKTVVDACASSSKHAVFSNFRHFECLIFEFDFVPHDAAK